MARRVIPSFALLWRKHETLYLSIFSTALARLAEKQDLMDEDWISKQLCLIVKDVCFEENQKPNCEIRRPVLRPAWEKPIPITGKRPDFTCECHNPFALSSEEFEISLHVECKLLGNPTSKNWILNKNYTIKGIKRFDNKSHEYGKQAPSGLMIGYIISMKPEDILNEVNNYQEKELPHNQALSFEFHNLPVFRGNQNLNRKNVKPKRFQLIHLWVDLRN